jgi:molybdopterin converting factor small subunit
MQKISPNRFAGICETNDALITGVRGNALSLSFFARSGLSNLLGRMNKLLFMSRSASLVSRHEVEIMYFGRTSELLMVTSERIVIPTERYTLGQLLRSLYKRGDRWMDELDDSHLVCTVDGQDAKLFDTVKPGAEICLFSKKSIFES